MYSPSSSLEQVRAMMMPVRKFVALATAWSAREIMLWCSALSGDRTWPKRTTLGAGGAINSAWPGWLAAIAVAHPDNSEDVRGPCAFRDTDSRFRPELMRLRPPSKLREESWRLVSRPAKRT